MVRKSPATANNTSLKIGDAAKFLGVSIDTLRRWEKNGKILPIRTPGSTRLYSLDQLKTLNPEAKLRAEEIPSTEEILEARAERQPISLKGPEANQILFGTPKTTDTLTQLTPDLDQLTSQPINQPTTETESTETESSPSLNLNKFITPTLVCLIALVGSFAIYLAALEFNGSIKVPLIPKKDIPPTISQSELNSNVLAASSIAREGKYLEVNGDSVIRGDLGVAGAGTFTENLTAPNIVYQITAGDNVTVTGDPQRPTISTTAGSETLATVTARGSVTTTGITLGNILNLGRLTSDPTTAISGATYYNTTSEKFRCYQNGSWKDCDTSSGGNMSSFKVSDNTNTFSISDGNTFTLAAGSNVSLSTDTSNKKITISSSAGGSFNSFTLAGDSGTSQTISDANTLTIVGGTNGIDTVTSDTDTITLNLDTTEVGTTTWNAGATDPTWTFNTSGATDPTLAFANSSLTIGSAATIATDQTSLTLFNTTATTINAFSAATTLNLTGASSGVLTLGNTGGTTSLALKAGSGGITLTNATSTVTTFASSTSGSDLIAIKPQSTTTTNAFTATLTTADLTVGNTTLTIPNTAGVADSFCLVTLGNCAGSGTGVTTTGGTSGQIAFFNGTQTIISETSGFGWDTTNKLFTLTSTTATGIALDIDANSLSSGTGLDISSTSTAAASNTQKGLNIALSGANAASSQTTYGAYISNIHTGTSATNVGLYATASGGGGNNYAGIFQSGNVGIEDTSPASLLTVGSGDLFQVNSLGAIAAVTGYTQGSGAFSATLTTTGSASFSSSTAGSDSLALKPQSTTTTNAFTATLTTADLTVGNQTFTFPNLAAASSDTVCLVTLGNCAGTGSGVTTTGGTSGQIAFFTGAQSILSETSGFGWDTTNKLLTLTGLSTATTSTTEVNTSAANTITSGGLFSAALTSSAASANFTGAIGTFSSNRTYTGASTRADTGSVLNLSRTSDNTNASGTYNITGPLLTITNTATQTAGTLGDSAALIKITQDADATGALLNLISNRSSTGTAILVEQTASGTQALKLTDAGNLSINGDLTVTGNDIAFGNGESISNATDNQINVNIGSSGTLLLTSSSAATIANSAGALAINAFATGLNLQADGTIDVNLAGGNSATGCTVTNSTGALACSGNITGPSTGTVGYWSRTATTLSPATANDIVSIATTNTTGADLAITNTGVYTGTGLVNITANSATSGDILTVSGTSLSSGSLLTLTGPSGGTAGVTDAAIKLTSDVGNIGTSNGLISSAATIDSTGAAANGVNLYLTTVNSNSSSANTAYGVYNNLTDAVALGNTDVGEYLSIANTGVTSASKSVYGVYSVTSSTGATGGTPVVYGGSFSATGDAGGTSTAYGIYASASGADNNYAGVFATGNVGVGTTTPTSTLHVVGQCVAAGTRIRRRRRRNTSDGGDEGDSSEVDWEDIPVEDIEPDDEILTLNDQTGDWEWHKVEKTMDMGVQEVYKLYTKSGFSIETTSNHPYLVKTKAGKPETAALGGTYEVDQSPKLEQLTHDSFIAIANEHQIFVLKISKDIKKQLFEYFKSSLNIKHFGPIIFARSIASLLNLAGLTPDRLIVDKDYSGYEKMIEEIIIQSFPAIGVNFESVGKNSPAHIAAFGFVSKKEKHKQRLMLHNKKTAVIPFGGTIALLHPEFHRDSQIAYGLFANLYHKYNSLSTQWIKVKYLQPGMLIATSHGFEPITAKYRTGRKQTYDLQIEGTHNFLANDIIAHNTYINSASATLDAFTIDATSLTTGSGVVATGPSSTGVTDHFFKLTSDIGSGASLLNLNPDFSGSGVTGYGIYNTATDATANANTDYGIYQSLALTGNAAKNGYGIYSTVTNTSTTAATQFGGYFNLSNTGVVTATGDNNYGIYSTATRTGSTTAGTTSTYGGYFTATGDSGGASTTNAYGIYSTATGGDNNYAGYFDLANTGQVYLNSTLSGGARSVSQMTIIQPSNGSNDSSASLLVLNNQDAGSTGYVETIYGAAGGGGIDINNITTGIGINMGTGGNFTTGKAINIEAGGLTTGNSINIGTTAASSSTDRSGNIINVALTQGNGSNGTANESRSYLNISRANDVSSPSITNLTGDLVSFSSNCEPVSGGTCTDSSDILQLTQSHASATGSVLNIADSATHASGGNSITVASNATTTGTAVSVSSTAMTTGEILDLTGTWTPTDGTTNEAIDLNITHSPTSSADNFQAINLTTTDGTALGNTVYNLQGTLTLTGNAAKSGIGDYQTVTSSSTTGDTLVAFDAVTSATGIVGSGNRNSYGLRSQPASTGASTTGTNNVYGVYSAPSSTLAAGSTENVYGGYYKATGTVASGTVNSYGLYVANPTMNTTGTSTKVGLYLEDLATTGPADSNYGICFDCDGTYSSATATNGITFGTDSGTLTLYRGSTSAATLTTNATTLSSSSLATFTTAATLAMTSTTTLQLGAAPTINGASGNINLTGVATGVSATGLVLPTKTDSGDPTTTQANGEIYYNSNSSKFRCYEGGSWKNCTAGSVTSVSNSDSTLTISPTTGDVIASLNQAASFTLTGNNTFTPSSTNGLTINLDNDSLLSIAETNSTATGTTITASSVTTGSALSIVGPTSTGVISGASSGFVKIATDVGSAGTEGSLLYLAPDFSAGSTTTGSGIKISATDATAITNNDYGINSTLALTSNAAKVGYGIYSTVTSSSTSADTLYGGYFATSATGNVARTANYGLYSAAASTSTTADTLYGFYSAPAKTGNTASGTQTNYGSYLAPTTTGPSSGTTATTNVYGEYISPTAKHAADAGTVNGYGLYVANGSMDGNGTSTQYGIYVAPQSGADTNYGLCFDCDGTYSSASVASGIQFGTDGTALTLFRGSTSAATLTTNATTLTASSLATFTTAATLAMTSTTTLQLGAAPTINAASGNINLTGVATGVSATGLVLPTKTDSGDPTTTQTNGEIYYNSNSSKFRCFEASAWTNCITSGGVTSVSNSDSTLTISPTTGAVIASLNLGNANTWTALQTFNSGVTVANNSNFAISSGTGTFTQNSTATGGGDFRIINTGVAAGAVTVAAITANSATTADLLTISGTSLTTGSELVITGPSSGTGVTDAAVKVSSWVGDFGGTTNGLISSTATFKGSTATSINLYLTGTDAVASGNTDYGVYNNLSVTGDTSATKTAYGIYSAVTNDNTATDQGARNTYAGYFSATGSSRGATTAYGLYATAASADTNYAAIFDAGNVGIGDTSPSSKLEIGDGTDSLQISSVGDLLFVDANGAASITGPDGGTFTITAANSQALTLATATAGDINLTPAGAGDVVIDTDSNTQVTLNGGGDGVDSLVLTDGDILISDGDLDLSGGDFNVTLDAGDSASITGTSSTSTAGTLDINTTSTTAGNVGFNIDYTMSDGVSAANDLFAAKINLNQSDVDGDLFGLVITNNATAALVGVDDSECLLCLDNAEDTAGVVTDAIRISSSGVAAGITNDIKLQNSETITNSTDGTIALGTTILTLTGTTTLTASSLATITASSALAVNGAATITTDQTSLTLFNTTATTVNAFSAATTLNLTGASSGAITLGNTSGTTSLALKAGSGGITLTNATTTVTTFSSTTAGADSIAIKPQSATTTNAFTATLTTADLTVGSVTLTIPNTAGVADSFCLLTLANCGSGTVTWNSIANPTGTQTLTFDDGELNAWTMNSDTESLWTIDANSLTTGQVLKLAHTTSVIANGGSLVKLSSTSVDTSTTTGTLLDLTSSGSTAGTLFLATNNTASFTGITQSISMTGATTGTGIKITGGGSNILTGGELIDLVLGTNTVGAGITITSTGTYTGTGAADGLINVVANSLTTGLGSQYSYTGLTTGSGERITGSGTTMQTGGELIDLVLGANTVGAGITITSTGTYTGTGAADGLINVVANSLTTGLGSKYSYTGLTSGSGERITGSGTTMSTGGELIDLVLGANTVGAGLTVTSTGTYTGVGAADGLINITANGLTTGYALNIPHTTSVIASGGSLANISSTSVDTATTTGVLLNLSSTASTAGTQVLETYSGLTTGLGHSIVTNGLTTGTAFNVSSTATAFAATTASGNGLLANFDWNPSSASTTGTGDLFRIRLDDNGTLTSGSIFNIVDEATSTFSVSETTFTTSLPSNFTAAGDIAVAYDLNFTNQTSSFINSNGPLTIRAGESFENTDLTLTTYGAGSVVFTPTWAADSAVTSNLSYFQVVTPIDTTGTNIHQGIDIAATIGNATGGTNTTSLINFDAITGDAQVTLNAINIGNLTGTAAAETAIQIGTGWDTGILGAGALTINSTGANTLTLDSTTTGEIDIGTNANAKIIKIGTGSTTSQVVFNGLVATPTSFNQEGQFALGVSGGVAAGNGRIWIRASNTNFRFQASVATMDYSEYMQQEDTSEPGDVMVLSDSNYQSVKKSGIPYDQNVLGVVTQYGTSYADDCLDDPSCGRSLDPHYANVGMLGQVYTKVSTEGGNIVPGDPLTTSSIPGVAMKATKAGRIVGHALDYYIGTKSGKDLFNLPAWPIHQIDGQNVGKILILLQAGWYDPSAPPPDSTDGLQFSQTPCATPGVESPNTPGVNCYGLVDSTGRSWDNVMVADSAAFANLKAGGLQVQEVKAKTLQLGDIPLSPTSPQFTLSAQDIATDSAIVSFTNASISDLSNLNVLNLSLGTAPTGLKSNFVEFVAGTTVDTPGTSVGKIRLNNGGVAYESGGADFAEYFDIGEEVENGDVVAINSDGTNGKATVDGKLLGVVTDSAAFVGNAKLGPGQAIVGLVGQVYTKVSTENGEIKPGDYLTSSSTPGVAAKAIKPGQTIGKSLEEFKCESPPCHGKIRIFINIAFADPNAALANLVLNEKGELVLPKLATSNLDLSNMSQVLTDNSTLKNDALNTASRLLTIDEKIATQSANLASLESRVKDLEEHVIASDAKQSQENDVASLDLTTPDILLATGSAHLTDLKVADILSSEKLLTALDATISGTFKALGDTFLGNTTVAGDLSVDGTFSITDGSTINSIPTLYIQNSTLADSVDFFNGKVTIDKTGTLKAATLVAEEYQVVAGQTSGSGIIPKGKFEVPIFADKVKAGSKVLITPTSLTTLTLSVTVKVPGSGFVVSVPKATTEDINFDWWIINEVAQREP